MPSPGSVKDQIDPEDFIPVASLVFADSRYPSQQEHIDVYVKQILRIGRDNRSNVFVLPDVGNLVSRNHCEIYAVKYDSGIHHIYARDRGSFNGTFVNGTKIGSAPEMSSGYLLQHGDEVQVPPYWKFTLSQLDGPPQHELTKVQIEEVKLFQDKYTLTTRCLGQGAEAAVYLATDAATKKQLVCKLVNLDRIQGRKSAEELRRRRQEVDILRQIQHPNILPYVDAISSPHTLYTFTDLAAGGDLMSFVYRHDVIPEFDAQLIVRQVVNGLEYLHQKGIVHRDLKPENILLANSPKIAYTRVMLSDFGASAVPHRNRMTTNVGTKRYQAPEFWYRNHTQGPPADMWSLGIVTLLLLAPDTDRDYMVLSRMDQQELEVSLKQDFFDISSLSSPEAQNFVWQCLRVQAATRLTASQAARHDWLNSSEAHVRFFEKIDNKILSTWKPRIELNAMPLELPCVLSLLNAQPTTTQVDGTSSYFVALDDSTNLDLESDMQVHVNAPSEVSMQADLFQKPALPVKTTVPKTKPSTISPPRARTTSKAALNYGEKARRRQSKRRRLSELNLSPDLKIHDGMHLPLNNLDRHLPPTLNTKKRRHSVLQELKQANALFLRK